MFVGGDKRMANYKISLEKLKEAGIKPEIGVEFSINLKDGTVANVKITKVEKDVVIAATE